MVCAISLCRSKIVRGNRPSGPGLAIFAGMAGAADTHSWANPKARTGQEILLTQFERLIRYYKSRKRERVAGKRGTVAK